MKKLFHWLSLFLLLPSWALGQTTTSNFSYNLLGGGTNQLPVQSSNVSTSFLAAPIASGQVLSYTGSALQWQSIMVGQLPGGGATTVNGTTCTLGFSCTVTAPASSIIANSTLASGFTNSHVVGVTGGKVADFSPSTTVNGQTCTLGGFCTVTAAATGITSNSTTASGFTNGYSVGISSGKVFNTPSPGGIPIELFGGVADNTTDNQPAFASAFAALSSQGGCVLLAGGTYAVNSTVDMSNYPGACIRGQGMTASVIRSTGNFSAIKAIGTFNSPLNKVAVRDLGASCTPAAVVGGTISGISFNIGVTISGSVSNGLILSGGGGKLAANTSISSGSGPYTLSATQATFTGTGSGTNLTVTNVTGTIVAGNIITGTGVPGSTTIVSQTSGTPGGAGVYVTNNSTTSSAATITATASQTVSSASFTGTGSGTNLTVTSVTGTIFASMVITGTGVPSGTIITSQTSGTPGGAGVYTTSVATTSSGASITAYPVFTLIYPSAHGIQFAYTNTGLIEGNQVLGCNHGYDLVGNWQLEISRNRTDGSPINGNSQNNVSVYMGAPTDVNDNQHNNTIVASNNVFQFPVSYGLRALNADGSIFTSNQWLGGIIPIYYCDPGTTTFSNGDQFQCEFTFFNGDQADSPNGIGWLIQQGIAPIAVGKGMTLTAPWSGNTIGAGIKIVGGDGIQLKGVDIETADIGIDVESSNNIRIDGYIYNYNQNNNSSGAVVLNNTTLSQVYITTHTTHAYGDNGIVSTGTSSGNVIPAFAPATGALGTIQVANGKAAVISNSLTFTGNDSASVVFGAGGTVLYGNQTITLSGDISGSGATAITGTLATVNSNAGSFGSSTAIPSFTVNGKGLITAASTNAVIAPASTLTGTVLASNVVTSSLTTVGTIGTGVWQGTKIGLAFGGTNADLSATGGASQVLKQVSSGAAITVAQLACGDLSNSGTACQSNTGTSGGNVPLLNGNNIYSGTFSFTGTGSFTNTTTLSGTTYFGIGSTGSGSSTYLGISRTADTNGNTTIDAFIAGGGTNTLSINTLNNNPITLGTGTLTIGGSTILSSIGTDTGLTDATLCRITSTGAVKTGSGTLGICLGTSSARYKTAIANDNYGLTQIVTLKPVSFNYKKGYGDGGVRRQHGFLAEDVVNVMPELTGLDKDGKPNTVDMLGMIPAIVNSIKELKAVNDNLVEEVRKLKVAK